MTKLRIVGKLTAAVLKLLSHPCSVISRVLTSLYFKCRKFFSPNFLKCNQPCLLSTKTSQHGDRRSHSTKTDNSSLKWLNTSSIFGTTLTNESSIQEEIKSSLKSGNSLKWLKTSNILEQR